MFNASLIYKFTSELQLYADFYQDCFIPDYGFDVLSVPPRDFTIDAAAIPFQPQKVSYYELGIEGSWQQVQASLFAFYNESMGTAYPFSPSGGVEIVRAPKRNYGIEAAIDWQPSADWQLGGLRISGGKLTIRMVLIRGEIFGRQPVLSTLLKRQPRSPASTTKA